MFSKQETFDQVAAHLLAQNKRAEDTNSCRYRLGKLKCAAGCLIPDDEYDKEYERSSVMTLCNTYQWDTFFGHDIFIVTDLQMIHDCCEPDLWENRLKQMAQRWGLKYKY